MYSLGRTYSFWHSSQLQISLFLLLEWVGGVLVACRCVLTQHTGASPSTVFWRYSDPLSLFHVFLCYRPYQAVTLSLALSSSSQFCGKSLSRAEKWAPGRRTWSLWWLPTPIKTLTDGVLQRWSSFWQVLPFLQRNSEPPFRELIIFLVTCLTGKHQKGIRIQPGRPVYVRSDHFTLPHVNKPWLIRKQDTAKFNLEGHIMRWEYLYENIIHLYLNSTVQKV